MGTTRVRSGFVAVAALAGAAIATSVPQAMPAEAACVTPSTALSLPLWRPAANEAHGTQQFDETALIELPASAKTISAELWGGGGGGGGGSTTAAPGGGAGGGGGASGGYIRGVLVIDHSRRYVLVVGDGGTGGQPGANGESGLASEICEGGTAVLVAAGGPAGTGAGVGGAAAPGGHWDESEMPQLLLETALQQPGHDGGTGQPPLLDLPGSGGSGGPPVRGSIDITGSEGGQGGGGAMRPSAAQPGADGRRGAVMIEW